MDEKKKRTLMWCMLLGLLIGLIDHCRMEQIRHEYRNHPYMQH